MNHERKKPSTADAGYSLEEFDFRKFNLGSGSATQKLDYLHDVRNIILDDKNHMKVFKDTIHKIKR